MAESTREAKPPAGATRKGDSGAGAASVLFPMRTHAKAEWPAHQGREAPRLAREPGHSPQSFSSRELVVETSFCGLSACVLLPLLPPDRRRAESQWPDEATVMDRQAEPTFQTASSRSKSRDPRLRPGLGRMAPWRSSYVHRSPHGPKY